MISMMEPVMLDIQCCPSSVHCKQREPCRTGHSSTGGAHACARVKEAGVEWDSQEGRHYTIDIATRDPASGQELNFATQS